LNLWRTAGLPNWASDARYAGCGITHLDQGGCYVLLENAATKSQRIGRNDHEQNVAKHLPQQEKSIT
jgi:hypothetical protein